MSSPSIALSEVRRRRRSRRRCSLPRLTLFGRSVLLVLAELAANLLLWIVAIALFAPDPSRRGVLSLVLVAWTLGLRHGLDVSKPA